MMLHRRLAADYEAKLSSAVAIIRWSMVDVITRRLTRASTPTWRDPPT
ncbi:hypothetical protein [Frankia nepalensis]|nr:hypothetical protein [Frankia nepalensis]